MKKIASTDIKILYPFGAILRYNRPVEHPELFFHSSSFGRQVYLTKSYKKYKVLTLHFKSDFITKNTKQSKDDDFLFVHRDVPICLYETEKFTDAVNAFYEATFALIMTDGNYNNANLYKFWLNGEDFYKL